MNIVAGLGAKVIGIANAVTEIFAWGDQMNIVAGLGAKVIGMADAVTEIFTWGDR